MRTPESSRPKRERETGRSPRLQAKRDSWVPRGRRRGGPGRRPARGWGEEGWRRSREGGDGTCLVSPQAPRAIPAPPGHGKEREGRRARRPDAGVSPASPKRNWSFGVQTTGVQLCGDFLAPSGYAGSSPRAWHPRGVFSPLLTGFSHIGLVKSPRTPKPFPKARIVTQPLPSTLGREAGGC